MKSVDLLTQTLPSSFRRIALNDEAKNWHAIPVQSGYRNYLDGIYRENNGAIELSPTPGKWLKLSLPEAFVPPPDSGKGDIQQSVFYLPGRAIVCATQHGCALFGLDGRLMGKFVQESPSAGRLLSAEARQREIYLTYGDGVYSLNISTGKLVKSRSAGAF